jgi:MFS superfamily sulfate permease-like transporter
MTAIAIAPLATGDPHRYAALAALLALLVGGICLLGRAARLGFLADLLSRPVLVGYMAGIALIMISGQLENVTGVPTTGDTFVAELSSFVRGVGHAHLPTLLLSAAVLAFLVAVAALLPRLPGPLLAVLLAAAATAVLSLDRFEVEVVGAVPAGLPVPALPVVSAADLVDLLLPALGVAIVAYSDNVLTGRAFAVKRREAIDADQEMLALGVANAASGFLHGFPGQQQRQPRARDQGRCGPAAGYRLPPPCGRLSLRRCATGPRRWECVCS